MQQRLDYMIFEWIELFIPYFHLVVVHDFDGANSQTMVIIDGYLLVQHDDGTDVKIEQNH